MWPHHKSEVTVLFWAGISVPLTWGAGVSDFRISVFGNPPCSHTFPSWYLVTTESVRHMSCRGHGCCVDLGRQQNSPVHTAAWSSLVCPLPWGSLQDQELFWNPWWWQEDAGPEPSICDALLGASPVSLPHSIRSSAHMRVTHEDGLAKWQVGS